MSQTWWLKMMGSGGEVKAGMATFKKGLVLTEEPNLTAMFKIHIKASASIKLQI
jgi:hypothetical protein